MKIFLLIALVVLLGASTPEESYYAFRSDLALVTLGDMEPEYYEGPPAVIYYSIDLEVVHVRHDIFGATYRLSSPFKMEERVIHDSGNFDIWEATALNMKDEEVILRMVMYDEGDSMIWVFLYGNDRILYNVPLNI